MFNVFDRLVSQSFGAQPGMSVANPGQPGTADVLTQALNKVRQQGQKTPEQQIKSDQKDVSDVYKQHNLALAARGEGPWAQAMAAGQIPEGVHTWQDPQNTGAGYNIPESSRLNQSDLTNYHIMRRAYMDAKQETDRLDSQEAEKEWKAHMAQRGIQGSIPGEGN